MSAANNNMIFVTPEELVRRSEFQPWWEIRDEANRFLMSAKPSEGSITIAHEHNNDDGKSLQEALNFFIQKGKGIFQFLRVKLGTKPNATNNYAFFAINLSEKTPEDLMMGFYYPTNTNPNPNGTFIINGAGNQQNQNFKQEQNINIIDQIKAMEERMQNMFESKMMEMEFAYREKLINLKEQQLEQKRREWEKNKKAELDEAKKNTFNWGELVDKSPAIVESLAGVAQTVISIAKGKEIPLAGSSRKEEVKIEEPKKEKKTRVTFSDEDSASDLKKENIVKSETQMETKLDLQAEFLAGLSTEQLEALMKSAAAMKEGKLHAEELNDVAENPETFFEEEEDEQKK
jgi:hypothetical protein